MSLPDKVPPRLLWHPLGFMGFGFGSGLVPVAPGTVGTLAALPLYLLLKDLPLAGYLAVVALLFLAGLPVISYTHALMHKIYIPAI